MSQNYDLGYIYIYFFLLKSIFKKIKLNELFDTLFTYILPGSIARLQFFCTLNPCWGLFLLGTINYNNNKSLFMMVF